MRRMEKKAMERAAVAAAQKAAEAVKKSKTAVILKGLEGHFWTITWSTPDGVTKSMQIAGRCMAIDLCHEMLSMIKEGIVTEYKCDPYLDIWECMSDDPKVYWRQFDW